MSLIIKKSICVLRTRMTPPTHSRKFSSLSSWDSRPVRMRNHPRACCISTLTTSQPCWIPELVIHRVKCLYKLGHRNLSMSNVCMMDAGVDSPGTVAQCLSTLTKTFTIHGVSEEDSSAMYIVAYALGHKTLHQVKDKQLVSDEEWQQMRELALIRCSYSPIQYVLGEWDFCDLTLKMKPPVFIPRPETEVLVSRVLKDPVAQSAKKFLEIGTGSGAISLTLLNSLPNVKCTAIEPSPEAYALTELNADKYKLRERLKLYLLAVGTKEFDRRISSWTKDGQFEFIVSNPPYVPSEDIANLPPEIASFEDRSAIDGGWDGLDIVRNILKIAHKLLKPGGSLWLEVDEHHPEEIKHLVTREQAYPELEYIQTYEDHNGTPRICQLKRFE